MHDHDQEALLRNELDRIVVALTTDTGLVVEQFVIDMPVRLLPTCVILLNGVMLGLTHRELLQIQVSAMTMDDIGDVESLFRSALLKLQNCSAVLEPISPGEYIDVLVDAHNHHNRKGASANPHLHVLHSLKLFCSMPIFTTHGRSQCWCNEALLGQALCKVPMQLQLLPAQLIIGSNNQGNDPRCHALALMVKHAAFKTILSG